jgi:hypothetical protein
MCENNPFNDPPSEALTTVGSIPLTLINLCVACTSWLEMNKERGWINRVSEQEQSFDDLVPPYCSPFEQILL